MHILEVGTLYYHLEHFLIQKLMLNVSFILFVHVNSSTIFVDSSYEFYLYIEGLIFK